MIQITTDHWTSAGVKYLKTIQLPIQKMKQKRKKERRTIDFYIFIDYSELLVGYIII